MSSKQKEQQYSFFSSRFQIKKPFDPRVESLIQMWTKLRTSKAATDQEKLHRRVSINTEYLSAFRTKSYVEFFTKAQFLVTDHPSTSPKAPELLLQPEQDSIPYLLDCLNTNSDLKLLMHSYFDNSAEASLMCTDLLRSINTGHITYRFIHTSLESFSSSYTKELNSAISKLCSFNEFTNPFSSPTQKDFQIIHDKYISILQRLKLKKKQVTRRRRVVEYSKKATGVCLTAGCAGDQIDAAAKGTYIMNKDFDTMSRLVDRLHDEVERIKGMIRFWVLRDIFSQQNVVKELRRSGTGLKKLLEELEENVCLCLVTINRARLSVIEEIGTV